MSEPLPVGSPTFHRNDRSKKCLFRSQASDARLDFATWDYLIVTPASRKSARPSRLSGGGFRALVPHDLTLRQEELCDDMKTLSLCHVRSALLIFLRADFQLAGITIEAQTSIYRMRASCTSLGGHDGVAKRLGPQTKRRCRRSCWRKSTAP